MSWAKWDCLQCKPQHSQRWFCSNKFAPCAAPSSAVHTAPAAASGVILLTPGCPRGGLTWLRRREKVLDCLFIHLSLAFPGGSAACNAGDLG